MYVLRQRTDLHDEVAYYLQDILGNLFAVLLPVGYLWLLWTLRPFGQPPDNIWIPLTIFFLNIDFHVQTKSPIISLRHVGFGMGIIPDYRVFQLGL